MDNDKRTLFATSWGVKNFLINPETVIDAGPFGDEEIVLQLRAHATPPKPTGERELDWIFAKCRVNPTRAQRQLLEELAPLITPSLDEEEIRGDGSDNERRRERYRADLAKSAVLQDFQENIRPKLRDLMNRVSDTTYKAAMDFMKLIRWRYVKDCNFYFPKRSSIFWQASDGPGWRYIPSRPLQPDPLLGIQIGITKQDYAVDEVLRLLKAKQSPGLQYDLLCEARSLTTTKSQLSLVEAVQALEIGTKDAISRLCESATWLAFNVATPPVFNILKEYIPTMIKGEEVRNRFKTFITANAEGIMKIIHQRNELTHKGVMVDWKDAEYACDLVGDLLYKLDFACGVGWADRAVWRRAEVTAQFEPRNTTSSTEHVEKQPNAE